MMALKPLYQYIDSMNVIDEMSTVFDKEYQNRFKIGKSKWATRY